MCTHMWRECICFSWLFDLCQHTNSSKIARVHTHTRMRAYMQQSKFCICSLQSSLLCARLTVCYCVLWMQRLRRRVCRRVQLRSKSTEQLLRRQHSRRKRRRRGCKLLHKVVAHVVSQGVAHVVAHVVPSPQPFYGSRPREHPRMAAAYATLYIACGMQRAARAHGKARLNCGV